MKKGLILLNAYYESLAIDNQVSRLSTEFAKLGVVITTMRNADYTKIIDDNEIKCMVDKYDFCIYLDKDKYISSMLEKSGLRLFNSHDAILRCDDKMLTFIYLAGRNISMPKTLPGLLCYSDKELITDEMCINVENKLEYPMVIKECFGSRGEGIYLVNNRRELIDILGKVKLKPYLIQAFVSSSYGRDVRVLVVGGQAIGAMLRSSSTDFRSNIDLGGHGAKYSLRQEDIRLAERIARELELDYCGIDLLFDSDGKPTVLCEVNSNAFFAGFERFTEINVAEKYAEHIYRTIYKENID